MNRLIITRCARGYTSTARCYDNTVVLCLHLSGHNPPPNSDIKVMLMMMMAPV